MDIWAKARPGFGLCLLALGFLLGYMFAHSSEGMIHFVRFGSQISINSSHTNLNYSSSSLPLPSESQKRCWTKVTHITPSTCSKFPSQPYILTENPGAQKVSPKSLLAAPPGAQSFSFATPGFEGYSYGPGNRYRNFFEGLKNWEPNTFRTFYSMIGPEMLYIGFGEWVGPTVIYAGHLAHLSLGMDTDPTAFSELSQNVAVNKHLNLVVKKQCISDKAETLKMVGTGQSGSSLSKTGDTYNRLISQLGATFDVECQTLPVFLESLANDVQLREFASNDRRLFVKIDTEGAETFILPSLTEWVRCLPRKPVFFISTHDTPSRATPQQRAQIVEFFRSFLFVSEVTESRELSIHQNNFTCGADFTDAMLHDSSDYLASDIDPLR